MTTRSITDVAVWQCQMENQPSQAWNATHRSIAGGSMSGFVVASGDVAMGYWDQADLPFYYSLASTFPLANRWFASCPAQTYPNRRFFLAATASGLVGDPLPSPTDPPPANGTIYDRLAHHRISFINYFTDLPEMALIPENYEKYAATNTAPIARFHADAAAGTLPAVSRDQVEPAGAHPSRRQCRRPARLLRLPPARVPRASITGGARESARLRSHLHDRRSPCSCRARPGRPERRHAHRR